LGTVLRRHGHEPRARMARLRSYFHGPIRETGQGIGGFDFLNDDPAEKWGWIARSGYDRHESALQPWRRNSLRRRCSYTPNVACLMKIDYWNAVSRLPLWQRRIPQFFLPLTWRPAFLQKERGNSPLMNCAWCVWVSDEQRDLGTDLCLIEPMKKIAYPGYHAAMGSEPASRSSGKPWTRSRKLFPVAARTPEGILKGKCRKLALRLG
jgi:hypothetical protein